MTIAIQPNQSARIRQLKALHSYLEPKDLARLTGTDLSLVKAALSRRELRFKRKTRVPFETTGGL